MGRQGRRDSPSLYRLVACGEETSRGFVIFVVLLRKLSRSAFKRSSAFFHASCTWRGVAKRCLARYISSEVQIDVCVSGYTSRRVY